MCSTRILNITITDRLILLETQMVRLFVDYFGARWRCCQPLIYQNKFLNWLCHVLADAAAESIEVGTSKLSSNRKLITTKFDQLLMPRQQVL